MAKIGFNQRFPRFDGSVNGNEQLRVTLKSMDHIDTCVIGSGVVGLAIARELAHDSSALLVVDTENHYGQGISSRNSEVIHAGIYYPANSLKATLCVRGKTLLTEYCKSRGIPHRLCGKVIVATDQDEEQSLEAIAEKAVGNGVIDLELWSAKKMATEEPAIRATSALYSPGTGIVSAHDLMTAYVADIENEGGQFVGGVKVISVESGNGKFVLRCMTGGEEYVFSCRILVNSAGLGAQQVAESIDGVNPSDIPPLYFCKGSYFTLASGNPFHRLVYPVPEKSGAGLGVHATIDLGGQVKFGPDVEYVETLDYHVSVERRSLYYQAIRRYFPALRESDLVPGYAGIRPKLQGPDDLPADFVIQSENEHGVEGLIQLFGIESPGLTASLAIAERVSDRLAECG